MPKNHPVSSSMITGGFTMIELLVSVSIMLLLVGLGVASFLSFNNRQIVLETTRQLKTGLLLAQSKARAGEIPSGCTGELTGYRVQYNLFTCGREVLCITAQCTTENGPTQRIDFSTKGFSVSPANISLTYLVLDGGVVGSINTDIIVTYSGLSYSFRVNGGGSMTEGSWMVVEDEKNLGLN